jgi:hypothetical protein
MKNSTENQTAKKENVKNSIIDAIKNVKIGKPSHNIILKYEIESRY